MSIFNDKTIKSVAEAAAKVMEAELSPKQKAIAKLSEPKHKIDAGDLAKLRAGHKPVKEEQEQIDEVSLKTKVSAFAKRTQRGWDNDYAPEDDGVDHAGKAEKTLKHIEKRHGPKAVAKANKAGERAIFGKESVMEAEQIDEGIEDKIEAAREKAAAAGKKVEEPKKPAAPAKRKVEGGAYGGSKQKDKEEMEESVLSFTAMLESYTEHGLKAFVKEQVEEVLYESDVITAKISRGDDTEKVAAKHKLKLKKVDHTDYTHKVTGPRKNVQKFLLHHYNGTIAKQIHPEAFNEEVDNETYTKEVEDQKASMEGKKKQPKVAAAATQGVKQMPEEVEQIEERTLTEPEMKKKEEYVKGMKKKLSGFKQRYGERAKEVMYATATRMAKKD